MISLTFRPSEVASIQNLFKPSTQEGKTVYPISDKKRSPKAMLVVGKFTYFGASTKTGDRPVMPVPSPTLIEELRIRQHMSPEYRPEPGSKPESIVNGFDSNFDQGMQSAKCPVKQ